MEIYVVKVEYVSDMERVENEITPFRDKKDAQKYYKTELQRAKKDFAQVFEDWEIEEDENSFSAYPDGRYMEDHFDMEIRELELH